MFAYIKGALAHSTSTHVIVEAGGIGYKIFIPISAFTKMPQTGQELALHLSFIVREQSQVLYGFFFASERDFFEALLGVTGIGPKLALSLIGHLSLIDLQQAILEENIPALCKVPGIGKKGAERLIIEMRDKASLGLSPSDFSLNVPPNSQSQMVKDAMNALINLGYNQMIAQKAVQKTLKEIPEEENLATFIASALKSEPLVRASRGK